MGLTISVVDERGKEVVSPVLDPRNVLRSLLPQEGDESYPLLRYIDPYGDTIFNQAQVAALLEEWARIKQRAKLEEQQVIVNSIAHLAQFCLEHLHTYLKFVGD